jgi:hypothetical protein
MSVCLSVLQSSDYSCTSVAIIFVGLDVFFTFLNIRKHVTAPAYNQINIIIVIITDILYTN